MEPGTSLPNDARIADSSPSQAIAVATLQFATAYVSQNKIALNDIPGLIATSFAAVAQLPGVNIAAPGPAPAPDRKTLEQIAESQTDAGLISFIDGKVYKVLTRHLRKHGLSASQYRERFGLPMDYPMTTPAYSAQRAELARNSGLGQSKGSKTQPTAASAPGTQTATAAGPESPSPTTAQEPVPASPSRATGGTAFNAADMTPVPGS